MLLINLLFHTCKKYKLSRLKVWLRAGEAALSEAWWVQGLSRQSSMGIALSSSCVSDGEMCKGGVPVAQLSL